MRSLTVFPKEEYALRLEKVKEKMEQKGIDVLFLSDPANMNYLTGYDGWSFYVPQMVIVLLEEEEPYWFGRAQDVNGARATSWLSPCRLLSYSDEYVHSTVKHPMEVLAAWMTQHKKHVKRAGVEMEAYYFSPRALERLETGCPWLTFIDANLLVNNVRIIKSNREIAYMKKAGEIAARAMEAGVAAVKEGARVCDVAAAVSHAQIRGTDQFGGDYPSIVPLIPAGALTYAPHVSWTDETIKAGDPLIIELAGCCSRYHAPLARTVTAGKPKPEFNRLSQAVIEGVETVLNYIKPGVTCEEVEQKWQTVIARHGFCKDSRIGYSIGINYPPDWGEHTASLRPGDKTVLKPNMAFHLIPGIWLEELGVEISESFVVTEKGCETLSSYPRAFHSA
ncbi:Xaa-Pro dipeptidase [Alteribacillus persepolensis]|uniref:Xaa-Pro dipeptidase n=1 Tax=Alteribacillus persepolensis TaxID=568899 RepID=A0A1G8G4S8_9BACI|nr:M24 family metallopeptidase [Alteribacillus persepolensis]SDH89438.1 Xaa-Pro dipeptidase [Alteribacillus persepolensis]